MLDKLIASVENGILERKKRVPILRETGSIKRIVHIN